MVWLNKLFLAIGLMVVMTSLASAAGIWGVKPPVIGTGDSEGKMLLGGDSGITVSYGAEDEGFYKGGGSEIIVLSAGVDTDGKALFGDETTKAAYGEESNKIAAGAESSTKVAMSGDEGTGPYACQPIDGEKARTVVADDPDDDTG
ncbi:MAG: hypothetical protein V1708_03810 [Candidatus Micrarchaeota archaeon]